MKMLERLLEILVGEELLKEKAKSLNDVRKNNIALWIKDKGYEKVYSLYIPNKAMEMMKDFTKYNAIDALIGTISIGKSKRCGGWVVIHVAAQQGYGPLLYDIAMSDISPEGLASDRKSVTPAAQEVWNYNLTNRNNEFNIVDVPENCRNPMGDSRKPALNKFFAIKKKINFAPLVANHENFKTSLGTLQNKFDIYMTHAEQWFFEDLYDPPADEE